MKKLLWLLFLIPLLAISQESIKRNFYTTNQNPTVSGTNVSQVFSNLTIISNFYAPIITNIYLVTSNEYVTNLYVTNLTVQTITNVSNAYVTNLYVTNLTVNNITNVTEVTSNLFVTNIYVTNLYATNIYNSNFFSTNIFTTNLYATNIYNSNFFTTNIVSQTITNVTLVTSNLYTTNLYATNIYTSNFFTTNLFATNIYTSNFYTTNLISQFITNVTLVTSNLFTTNLYVSNFYATNVFATNLYVTNITIGGTLQVLYHDFTGTTNIDVSLSAWQGATLSASTAFRLTNSANGINPLLKFSENGAGGWVPTIAGIDQWDTPTNNWNTNALAVNYVRILNAGGTVHALLDGTNSLGGDTVWTNSGGVRMLVGLTNAFCQFNAVDESVIAFNFGTLLPGLIGPQWSFYNDVFDGTNVVTHSDFGSYGVTHNTFFQLETVDNGNLESLSITMAPDLSDGAIRVVTTNGTASLSGIFLSDRGTNTVSLTADGKVSASSGFAKGAFTGITTTNAIATIQGGIVTSLSDPHRVEPIVALTWASTTTIDLDSTNANYRTLTLGGNTTLATSNRAAGHWVTVILTGAATNCTLTLPAWHVLNQTAPTSLAANKVASLTVFFPGTTDAGAIANYAVEP